jgi:hypothetical protein
LVKWDKKKLLKGLAEDRKQNRTSNLMFIDLYVKWLKRTSNKEWSRQQKKIIDGVHKGNRHLKLKPAQ